MATWIYVPSRRLGIHEVGILAVEKKCTACKGRLLRLAERATVFPYPWAPTGYICCMCNCCYIEGL